MSVEVRDGATNEAKRAVLIVGHGSRREEANEDVREAARKIGVRGGFDLIAAAFLEITHPNIREGFAQLVAKGAEDITVHPYFLSPGRHTRGDIPVEVREAAALHPGITWRITEPLSAHRLVIDASIERIYEANDEETSKPILSSPQMRRGTVYLVGAGPGDPGLLTLRACELLQTCDVVIYDYLVNPELLRHVSQQAEKIYVGKIGGGRQTPQPEINALLIERARRGEGVVRLKGGDPFLFGRGAEEALALNEANIAFEVVPGISSALAVPAYAGIPLTHRTQASSIAVLTGAYADDDHATRREAIARLAAANTLVILMGIARLREIADDLITAGRLLETPAAIIRWGTYQGQQTIVGTLGTIAFEAERAKVRPPAVIVVGEVVRLRERLRWFEKDFENHVNEETAVDEFKAVMSA
ncbi:MAG: uroporphyrinogen-III C-methyltransferase [Pyrinomonadaceae bacterium]